MSDYRIELRIFGLLVFALISTLLLYFGLSAANVEGQILGVKIVVVGPAACFITLVLIFFATGLFKLGLPLSDPELLPRPAESLSQEQIDRQLDIVEIKLRQFGRIKDQLDRAKAALEAHQPEEQALGVGGIRRVSRPT